MSNIREFNIFFDIPVSEAEKGAIFNFLHGFFLMKTILSTAPRQESVEQKNPEKEGNEWDHLLEMEGNQWIHLLETAGIQAYFEESFNWPGDKKFPSRENKQLQAKLTFSDPAHSLAAATKLREFFNHTTAEQFPSHSLEESSDEEAGEEAPLLTKTHSNEDSEATTINSAHQPQEKDIYLAFCQHVSHCLPKENSAQQVLPLKVLVCYLIRDIVYKISIKNKSTLPYDPGLANIFSEIQRFGLRLSNHHKPSLSSSDDSIDDSSSPFLPPQKASLPPQKASNTSIPLWLYLNFLYDHFFRNLQEKYPDSQDNINNIKRISEENNNHMNLEFFFNTVCRMLIPSINKPLPPNRDSLADCYAKKEGLSPLIGMSRADHVRHIALEKDRETAAQEQKRQTDDTRQEIQNVLSQSIDKFAEISPLHTYLILTELKQTQTLNNQVDLESSRKTAEYEYKLILDIIPDILGDTDQPTQSQQLSLLTRYQTLFLNTPIEKMLAFLAGDYRRFNEAPFDPDPAAANALLNIIAYSYYPPATSLLGIRQHNDNNDIVLKKMKILLITAGIITELAFPENLLLDRSYLMSQLYHLDAPYSLSIPLNTFLLSSGAGIYSYPGVCGVTLAYFILLLHCSRRDTEKTEKIQKTFDNYQTTVLNEWFSFHAENKKTFFIKDSCIDEGNSGAAEVILRTYQVLVAILKKNIFPGETENSLVFQHYYPIVLTCVEQIKTGLLNSNRYPHIPADSNSVELNEAISETEELAGTLQHYILLPKPFIRSMMNNNNYEPLLNILDTNKEDGLHYFQQIVTQLIHQLNLVPSPRYALQNVNMKNNESTQADLFAFYALLNTVFIHNPQHPLTTTLQPALQNNAVFDKVKNQPPYIVNFIGMKESIDHKEIILHYQEPGNFNQIIQAFYAHDCTLDKANKRIRAILQCLLVNDLSPINRRHAAAVFYPSHEHLQYYSIHFRRNREENSPYYRYTPLWLSVVSNTTPVVHYMAALITSIWHDIQSDVNSVSAAEFRFLIKVICDVETHQNNVYTQALKKTTDNIQENFTQKLREKISTVLQERYSSHDIASARNEMQNICILDESDRLESAHLYHQKSKPDPEHPVDRLLKSYAEASCLFFSRYPVPYSSDLASTRMLDALAFITMITRTQSVLFNAVNQARSLSLCTYLLSTEILVPLAQKWKELLDQLGFSIDQDKPIRQSIHRST